MSGMDATTNLMCMCFKVALCEAPTRLEGAVLAFWTRDTGTRRGHGGIRMGHARWRVIIFYYFFEGDTAEDMAGTLY